MKKAMPISACYECHHCRATSFFNFAKELPDIKLAWPLHQSNSRFRANGCKLTGKPVSANTFPDWCPLETMGEE